MKKEGQREFERHHLRAEFMAIFKKNYLWEEDDDEEA